ncbi:anion exchange protein 2, slc4a2 [Culex quinquefasciatus]|uniref:Anion exchange protein 2, slc4a2 n=1 Tax=Culex quinquefasciatus TaxID=7176 RepID=B0XEE9_CULQU|nr:anion exchange protein 2, slc4a2 [Culex quinquefasciatus]|eukprot:XP_001868021.1 anion exchange protein 2, slc4a2 [Culex quinquefasciatus]
MAVVLLDLPSVAYRILEQMVNDELIHEDDKPVIRRALRLRRQQALPRWVPLRTKTEVK